MHMHAILVLEETVRTTIEIRDDHRAKLLEIAARRGEKGFSAIVAEALELFLRAQEERDGLRRLALEMRGSLDHDESESLRRDTERIRTSWR
jgi:hypothetical protein